MEKANAKDVQPINGLLICQKQKCQTYGYRTGPTESDLHNFKGRGKRKRRQVRIVAPVTSHGIPSTVLKLPYQFTFYNNNVMNRAYMDRAGFSCAGMVISRTNFGQVRHSKWGSEAVGSEAVRSDAKWGTVCKTIEIIASGPGWAYQKTNPHKKL